MGKDNKLEQLRREYLQPAFDKKGANPDPFRQFDIWFDQIINSGNPEPNSMTLATANASGQPSLRVVLLKGMENGKFIFYTNYLSQKGKEIEENPRVALNFYWPELSRQVRIEGLAGKIDRETSEKYFKSRPVKSQIGAWASPQSAVIENRKILEKRFEDLEEKFGNSAIKKPVQWGGYAVAPISIEFWQGRPNRLHDRILYTPEGKKWKINRLAP